ECAEVDGNDSSTSPWEVVRWLVAEAKQYFQHPEVRRCFDDTFDSHFGYQVQVARDELNDFIDRLAVPERRLVELRFKFLFGELLEPVFSQPVFEFADGARELIDPQPVRKADPREESV